MSEPVTHASHAERTVAEIRRGRWPGWIWAVPIAALGIVLWLLVREVSLGGTTVTVIFEQASGIEADSTVVRYRGVEIGKVKNVSLSKDGSKVLVQLSIHDADKKYLRAGTRFYLEGANPSLTDPASLKAVLSGPTIEMRPGVGEPAHDFVGILGTAPAVLQGALAYRLHFNGAVGELRDGASVTLRGFKVGEVTDVRLGIDPTEGSISTTVLIALDPRRFHIEGVPPQSSGEAATLNGALRSLVTHNLRARITQSPPFIGSREIELATVPHAAPAALQRVGSYFEIPTTEPSDIRSVVEAAG